MGNKRNLYLLKESFCFVGGRKEKKFSALLEKFAMESVDLFLRNTSLSISQEPDGTIEVYLQATKTYEFYKKKVVKNQFKGKRKCQKK